VMALGGCKSLTNVTVTTNIYDIIFNSENVGAKVHIREGDSPNRQLRSLIN